MDWPLIGQLLLLPGLIILFVVLYRNGFMVVNAKTALVYVGSRGKQRVGASFSACTGYVKRVIRFRESREYTLHLRSRLTSGSMCVEILNAQRQLLLILDASCPTASVSVDPKSLYHLVLRFDHADGDFELTWK